MSRSRWAVAAPLLAALLTHTVACATRQKWEGGPILSQLELVQREFGPLLLAEEVPQLEMPDIPMPMGLRPCCAFGAGLRAQLGPIPIPMFALRNVIGVDDLGPHQYDHGTVSFHSSRPGGEVTGERNGLVYTCRGGFVDTAHLRDWADWTLFLSARIARTLESGTTITLPDEAGQRRIVVRPVDRNRVLELGRLALAVPLAEWVAFQLSVWHEIATWYGWSELGIPQEVSSFSPEDLYSNLLGIKTAAVLIYQSSVSSEAVYNESMNVAIRRLLLRLGAVSGETGRMAMHSVDGLWWDSRARLPDKHLLLRRYLDHGDRMSPWLVTSAWRSPAEWNPAVASACAGKEPLALANPDGSAGIPFATQASFEIGVSARLAARMSLPDRTDGRITQDDFAAIIDRIRAQNDAELGPGACSEMPQP